jgi:hypothetical protein
MAKERAKEITNQMIEIWDMTNTDWMGYEKGKKDIFSYHHLRVAKRNGGPISIDNGAILCGESAHPYLHVVERYDRDMFLFITKILIQVNDQCFMPTYDQLLRIDAVLNIFEREHCSDANKKGYPLIRESFTKRLVKKKDFYFFE